MENRPWNVDDIYLAALERSSAEERNAYLESACAGNPELRRRVERLLEVQGNLGSFLEAPAPEICPTSYQPVMEKPGSQIGPYKLLQQIGEGGMGVVYLAEQLEPVKRRVALKIIKPGMDTRQVIARFELERQALSLMDHPNIAKVLEAGTTQSGRPYFVMELVKGQPITQYCDEKQLTPRKRLELLLPVCQAIQHAHQKGIIHRDIKPTNILVAEYDQQPVPKVIDFGVAKAIGSPLTEKTMFTGLGQIVGTLEYMSPEQAEVNQLDIDTRSDIYSLGVLLYELLAGSPPFSRQELEKTGMLEMLRVIREDEPSKPSTKLSTAEGLPTLAANRGTEPAKLTKLVRGELDWIVMKALEKDRNRRYETANGFAMDVQRYLADEPVQACPPSVGYRFRKFARRNRAAVLTAAAILFVLVAGIAGTTFGLIRAEQRRAEADQARANEAAQRQIADAEKKRAVQAERQTLADYRASTDDAIEQLIGSKSNLGPQDRAYLESALKRWRAYAARQGDDDWSQALRAEGHSRVATLWAKLGQREKARMEFETTRDLYMKLVATSPAGSRYQDILASTHQNLGAQLNELGQRDAARTEYEAARDLQQKLMAAFPAEPRYPLVLASSHISLGNLLTGLGQFDAAHTQFKTAHDLHKKLTADFPAEPEYQNGLAHTHERLGSVLSKLGQHGAARMEYETARDLYKKLVADFPDVIKYQEGLAAVHHHLGGFLGDLGQRDTARTEYEAARDLFKKLAEAFPAMPQYQRELAATHNNLAPLLVSLGQRDAAVLEYEAALNLQKKLATAFPAEPEYQVVLGGGYCNYGTLVLGEDRPADSLPWFDLAIRTLTPAYEQDGRAVQVREFLRNSHSGQAGAYNRLRKVPEAIAGYHKAIEIDPKHSNAYFNLGLALQAQGKLDGAIAAYRKAIEVDPKNASGYRGLGTALQAQGKLDEAIAAYRQAIEVDPKNASGYYNLGRTLQSQKKLDAAIDAYRKVIELDPKYANAHHGLGLILSDHRRDFENGAAYFRKAIELDPKNAGAYRSLGTTLRRQKKLDEAIAAFRKAIELSPNNAATHHTLAWLLATCAEARFRDPQQAIALAQKAIELDPKNPAYPTTLGVAHYRAGNWKAALESLDKSTALGSGGDGSNWFFLAMAHWQLGDKQTARKWYDEAVEWMVRNQPRNEELSRFQAEAAEVFEIKK